MRKRVDYISANKIAKKYNIVHNTLCRYIAKYNNELKSLGIAEIKKQGMRFQYVVYKENELMAFLKNKNIYFED
jgi:DNA-binding transcriptional regulator LsrR (DeoR family)